ncbi:MAG: type II toxin-antitoxin system HipA family toxin, partial [Pseudomonadota bacterium]
RLSPAFDVAYAYNPDGAWTSTHQMSLNGKRDGFEVDDLLTFAVSGGVKRARARALLARVSAAVDRWPVFAERAGVPARDRERVGRTLRRHLFVP